MINNKSFKIPDQGSFIDRIPPFALVEGLLYGIHLALYCLSVFILMKRRKTSQLIMLAVVTTMFALATADIAMSFRLLLHDMPKVVKDEMELSTALVRVNLKTPLFITSNFLADGLLVYRCYMVWEQRYILIGSAILLVTDTVLGFYNTRGSIFLFTGITAPLFLWTTLVVNIIMTSVTAGRIWWVARSVQPLLPKQAFQRYIVAITVLIESGAIYSASLMLFLLSPPGKYGALLEAFPVRFVGIMPILMIVQVELGRGTNFGEIETLSRLSSLVNPSHWGGPMKRAGAVGAQTKSPGTLKTERRLTVTESYRNSIDIGPSVERPPNIRQVAQRY